MFDTPVEPRDAATVLLIQDRPSGLEVFMVVRHPKIEFAAGALVFPGGSVDQSDREASASAVVSQDALELSPRELAWRIAAVREVYEECGVLLAREHGSDELISAERLRDIDRHYSEALRLHSLNIVSLAVEENLELACDVLLPFAHWVTPESRPKRFDTRFYMASAPLDQVARHDGFESVHSLWGNPDVICSEADQGKWHLRFPTRMCLEKLAMSNTCESALQAADNSPVVRILSKAQSVPQGNRIRIPAEAGYGLTEAIVDDNGKVVWRR